MKVSSILEHIEVNHAHFDALTEVLSLLLTACAHDLRNLFEFLSFETMNDLLSAIVLSTLEVLFILSAKQVEISVCHEVSVMRVPDAANFFKFKGGWRPRDACPLASTLLRLGNLIADLSHKGGHSELRVYLNLPGKEGLIRRVLRKTKFKQSDLHKVNWIENRLIELLDFMKNLHCYSKHVIEVLHVKIRDIILILRVAKDE